MHIFFLDRDTKRAANLLYRKHLTISLVSATQILCNAVPDELRNDSKAPRLMSKIGMESPLTAWASESMQNFGWLFDYTLALCDRYQREFGIPYKHHSMITSLGAFLMRDYGAPFLPDAEFTDPPCLMPPKYLLLKDDAVINYRFYYIFEKHNHFSPKRDKVCYAYLKDFFDPETLNVDF